MSILRDFIDKKEGKLTVIRFIGFCLILLGLLGMIVGSFLDYFDHAQLVPGIISIAFFIIMFGFSIAFPSLLEGREGLSTMRIVVFMVTNVICMILLKLAWSRGITSLEQIKLDQYWVGIIAFTFGAKATQSFFESKLAVPKPSENIGAAALSGPYVAMGNNPSRYSDFLGDTLMPTGEGVSEFKNVVGEQTGGFYKAIVSKGILILKPTGKEGAMTPAQQAFYDQMDEVIKGHKFEVEFVKDDPMVTGGNFDLGKVDINDVKRMRDGPVFNSASGLIHEIVEQYFKELKYDAAHIKGLDAEEKITGYRRDDESQQNKVVNDEHGTTIITKLKYYKGEEMREIIIGINGGNIVNVLTK